MTGNEYQELAARTINKGLTFEEQKFHALHGMVGEIGEIHSIYQKMYQGHAFEVDHVKKEFGDLLWFIAEYCTAKGWSLDDIMRMNNFRYDWVHIVSSDYFIQGFYERR